MTSLSFFKKALLLYAIDWFVVDLHFPDVLKSNTFKVYKSVYNAVRIVQPAPQSTLEHFPHPQAVTPHFFVKLYTTANLLSASFDLSILDVSYK